MEEIINENLILPMVALRGKVIFPETFVSFDVGRNSSVLALEEAQKNGGEIFVASQKSAFTEIPTKEDVNAIGVVCKIMQMIKLPSGVIKLSVEGKYRAEIVSFNQVVPFFKAEIKKRDYILADATSSEAGLRLAKNAFLEFNLFDKRISKEVLVNLSEREDANQFIDNALTVLLIKDQKCQKILDEDDTLKRLEDFCALIKSELEIIKIEKKIDAEVKSRIDKSQKEYFLREQLKAIHGELGDNEDEKDTLEKKIKDKKLPKEIEDRVLKEVSRLDKINPSSPDYSVILNYIDWITELPFNECTKDTEDLKKAKAVLDSDHFGLEKVKERILEYISVLHLTKEIKGPILCFVGPPGVGKTSIAKSVARALDRKFIRMSLGGLKDEAEIRGHRRTYVGAMPGKIITGIKNAGANNPVFLLDEIDKLSSDIHGDPASALLEVLDPEQNSTFRDRFLDIPYDLSKVIFITTANSLETIPYPLLDRMEIIEINGYTEEEKIEIAKRYLCPKEIKACGLTDDNIRFTTEGIKEIISGYTMEAGVRNLEREIGSVTRKVAVTVAEGGRKKRTIITAKKVNELLGVKKSFEYRKLTEDEVGTATGLAWTAFGGVSLIIEVALTKGKGEVSLTGKLGDVMKESAHAGISYIKRNAKKYGIDEKVFAETDIHIHVPEGATPKDGPSAGITMATALLSAFTGRKVRSDIAMTGEITLRGKVLPIGGLKEKALAAVRLGIINIIMPKGNEKNISDIPEKIRKEINFIPVENVDEVFENALTKE